MIMMLFWYIVNESKGRERTGRSTGLLSCVRLSLRECGDGRTFQRCFNMRMIMAVAPSNPPIPQKSLLLKMPHPMTTMATTAMPESIHNKVTPTSKNDTRHA